MSDTVERTLGGLPIRDTAADHVEAVSRRQRPVVAERANPGVPPCRVREQPVDQTAPDLSGRDR